MSNFVDYVKSIVSRGTEVQGQLTSEGKIHS